LVLDPVNETIVLLLASVETAKFRDVIPRLEAVLEVHPLFFRSIIRLIELSARAGRLKSAWKYVERAKCKDPGYFFVSGLFFSYSSEYDQAMKFFKKSAISTRWQLPSRLAMIALLANPDRKYVWVEKKPLSTQEKITRARSLLDLMEVDSVTKSLTMCEILCSENTDESLADASRRYSQILNEHPTNAAANVGLARCLIRCRDYSKATKILETVLIGKPFHDTYTYFEEAYLMRAHLVAISTNYRSAQHYVYLAIDLNQCCKKGWEMSAAMHLRREMYVDAARSFGRWWDLVNREDPEVGYHLSVCLMKAGNYEDALAVYREVMDLYPGYKDLKERVLIPSFKKIRN
jgi:tetratricopeptide (TPR) repeat protein